MTHVVVARADRILHSAVSSGSYSRANAKSNDEAVSAARYFPEVANILLQY